MKNILTLILIFMASTRLFQAQVLLDADGEGDTYELINSVLAPGYNVVEAPDCAHPEFGRHIDEVMDDYLGIYVFRFHIHVSPDNDRCKTFDRQRNEIKSYSNSPENLKARAGETVEYKWKFKLDSGFQPSTSFTHLHQLKAVSGSEASMPLITFTARKGSPNKMQLRYAKNTSQITRKSAELKPFLGEWVEAYEKVLYGEEGTYEMKITRVRDDSLLMEYSNSNIRMWKTGASFIRPKWGIYRSLNVPSDLRDEEVLFANYSIEELDATPTERMMAQSNIFLSPNPCTNILYLHNIALSKVKSIQFYGLDGSLQQVAPPTLSPTMNVSSLRNGIYIAAIRFIDGSQKTLKFHKQTY